MHFKPLNVVIALAISALIAFGFWSLDGALKHYVLVGAFLSLGTTLMVLIGVGYDYERRGINVRIISSLFLLGFLVINAIFALADFSSVLYVIVSASGLLIFVLLANSIESTRQ
jgi:hypothetical protein